MEQTENILVYLHVPSILENRKHRIRGNTIKIQSTDKNRIKAKVKTNNKPGKQNKQYK